MPLASDIDDARLLERQTLLARVDEHPWSQRIEPLIDECAEAFDGGDGDALQQALRRLIVETHDVLGQLSGAFPPTLSEPAYDVMAAMRRASALLSVAMELAANIVSSEHAAVGGPMLLAALAEISGVVRRAVLHVPVEYRFELNAHRMRQMLAT